MRECKVLHSCYSRMERWRSLGQDLINGWDSFLGSKLGRKGAASGGEVAAAHDPPWKLLKKFASYL
jgi:hypothetical protein